MVTKTYTFAKSAFTMIELIFAIVIIGITAISLPMVNQIVSKGVEGNLVQEAIFAASAELNQVLSYHWDESSTDSNSTLAKVIWTSSTDCNSSTKLRIGHVNEPLHRRCLDDSSIRPSTTLGFETNDVGVEDDIDDNIKSASAIFTQTAGTSTGYKQDYNSTIDVAYAAFGTVPATDHNIKKITLTISTSNKTITVLNAYSANIGEIDYAKRSY